MAENKDDLKEQVAELELENEGLDQDVFMNLAGSIFNNKDDNEAIDLSGMMMMAANLLKDDNLLSNLGFAQHVEAELQSDYDHNEFEVLSKQLHDLTSQNHELKEELIAIKEQISETKDAISQLAEASQKRRWWQR